MRRTTLILIIVLAVVLLGGGAYVWLMRDSIELPWAATTNTTAVTNTATNTSLPTTNTSTTTAGEVKGETALTGTLTVGTAKLTLNSVTRNATVSGEQADAGKQFVVVYFDALEPALVSVVDRGIREITVTDSKSTYALESLKVASTYAAGDRGYVRFVIPDTAKGLSLVFGTGATAQKIVLP